MRLVMKSNLNQVTGTPSGKNDTEELNCSEIMQNHEPVIVQFQTLRPENVHPLYRRELRIIGQIGESIRKISSITTVWKDRFKQHCENDMRRMKLS